MKQNRLLSLDALRGFDMFFITGGAGLIMGLCAAFGWGDGWLSGQMRHVAWAGLAHHDTIFPLFLFLAGVSWPFSYASQVARGRTSFQIHRKVILRAAILFFFGISGGLLAFNPHFRIPSVLGHIGVSWGIAAIIFMHVKNPYARGGVIAAILIAYWALFNFFVAPGAPADADHYARSYNIVSYFDRTIMPNHIYQKDYDPESLISAFSGTATALLGMCAGALLKSERFTAARKSAILALSSVGLLIAAFFFIYVLKMPIVKALWSSSFVLAVGAYSAAMLALFYWLVDVKGWKKWTFYFRVIGMNSITIYMLQMMGIMRAFHNYVFGGFVKWVGQPWTMAVNYLTWQLLAWLILYFFYKKNIFLKV